MKRIFLIISTITISICCYAQSIWKNEGWRAEIAPNGCINWLSFDNGTKGDTVLFFTNEKNAGPLFYMVENGETKIAKWEQSGTLSYQTRIGSVECQLEYITWERQPSIKIGLTNTGHVPFQPTKAGLKFGIDTYMDKYPDWFDKHFPTFLSNQPTHFYGYMQSPKGHLLGLLSPDPIASWSIDYNLGYQDPAPHWFMGHRIESVNIDLLNALPLPSHNPQHLWKLEPGEGKSWIIAMVNVPDLESFESSIYSVARLPMIRMEQTNFEPGEEALFEVLAGEKAQISVHRDSLQLAVSTTRVTGRYQVKCVLPKAGLYTIQVMDNGKQVEGILSAHSTWSWTLKRARENAWRFKQKASSHIESWYGFHSSFLAARYFPDTSLDCKIDERFDHLFNLLHDTIKMEPKYHKSRIQNTSGTIGLLVDRYEAYGNIHDLMRASKLADWLIVNNQRKDGAYVNHNTIYTSVIYVAKSILELSLAERKLSNESAYWKSAAKRHFKSAGRAIEQLARSQGDFETEGEMTFEDGMISCSALQMGMYALMQDDKKQRDYYTKAMLEILNTHSCLAQLKVPDARRRGGTMRYWEAQYDVQMLPNMFNSPHGWSGWRAYATYYAYLLTGDEKWLLESYNAMGAFSHLIDSDTGLLRWAFVVDPYLKVKQTCSPDTHFTADSLSFGNPHPELYPTKSFVLGEQYVNMISDWQGVNTQDNDVHELFKFMGEAFLTNAFVVEREDGTLKGYNCSVTQKGDIIEVVPVENQMVNLHCNLKRGWTISFGNQQRTIKDAYRGWCFGADEYVFSTGAR